SEDIRKYATKENAASARSNRVIGLDVLVFLDRERTAVGDPLESWNVQDTDNKNHVGHRRAEECDHKEAEQNRRKREDRIAKAHQQAIDQPSEIGSHHSERSSSDHGEDDTD